MTATGEIDYGNIGQFREAMQQLVHTGGSALEVDLAGVGFIDSSGISVLLEYKGSLRKDGRQLNLIDCSPPVYRTLFGCGLADVLGISGDSIFSSGDLSGQYGCRWLISSFSVPAGLTSPSTIRDHISQLIGDLHLPDAEAADIKLAVGEAATNAVKYGCKTSADQISIYCTADSTRLVIEVSDRGPGFDPRAVPAPNFDGLPTGGMGIALMRLVMDEVKFGFKHGTTVRMVKRLK
jgi:anti-anti-sigma factor